MAKVAEMKVPSLAEASETSAASKQSVKGISVLDKTIPVKVVTLTETQSINSVTNAVQVPGESASKIVTVKENVELAKPNVIQSGPASSNNNTDTGNVINEASLIKVIVKSDTLPSTVGKDTSGLISELVNTKTMNKEGNKVHPITVMPTLNALIDITELIARTAEPLIVDINAKQTPVIGASSRIKVETRHNTLPTVKGSQTQAFMEEMKTEISGMRLVSTVSEQNANLGNYVVVVVVVYL